MNSFQINRLCLILIKINVNATLLYAQRRNCCKPTDNKVTKSVQRLLFDVQSIIFYKVLAQNTHSCQREFGSVADQCQRFSDTQMFAEIASLNRHS